MPLRTRAAAAIENSDARGGSSAAIKPTVLSLVLSGVMAEPDQQIRNAGLSRIDLHRFR